MEKVTKMNKFYRIAYRQKIKKRYPDNPQLKKIIKLYLQWEELNRSIDGIWRDMKNKGFRPGIDNENEKFFSYFDNLKELETKRDKISNKITRLEEKGVDLEKARDLYCKLNITSESF